MGWSLFLNEARKAELDTDIPSDVICSCSESNCLLFEPNDHLYVAQGGCDTDGICACISIEKHKARTSTRHFLKAQRNRKSKRKASGPLDRFIVIES
ncbi:MAG: hypothetical protein ACFFGZ_03765 [Candidatus Thorarchaeota archaeon]